MIAVTGAVCSHNHFDSLSDIREHDPSSHPDNLSLACIQQSGCGYHSLPKIPQIIPLKAIQTDIIK